VLLILQSRSRAQPRSSAGSVFLFNNITPWHSAQPRWVILFNANLPPLFQALAEDPRSRADNREYKEQFTCVYGLLDKTRESHGEDAACAEIADEVVRLAIPILQRFMQRTWEKKFSQSTSFAF
jgi:hypothetical protein